MDDATLKKALFALKWEYHYLRKDDKEYSLKNNFLVPQTALDPDFDKYLVKLNITGGKALDIGTGTGEQAVFLAQKGFGVTATDVSASAIKIAKELPTFAHAGVTFIEDNILQSRLTGFFDLITDRGCFTLLHPMGKKEYVQAVKKLLKPGGWLFIKADNNKTNLFSLFKEDPDFSIHAMEHSNYTTLSGRIVPAIVLVAQKTG